MMKTALYRQLSFGFQCAKNKLLRASFSQHILAILFLIIFSAGVRGQIAAWQLNGSAGTETTIVANILDTNLNTSSITRGSGLNSTALANAYGATNYTASGTKSTAISGNKFIYFTLNTKVGYKVSLSTLDVRFRRSGTGPNTFRWQYSIDGTNYSDLGGADISYSSTTTGGDAQTQINLSGVPALQNVTNSTTITIRLLGWGASATTGTFAIGRSLTAGATDFSLAIGGTVTSATSVPTVTTTSVSSITATSASSGGNVTADGGATVSARGVYFGTSATPSTGTSDGTGTGTFISSLSSLSVNTQYYYRAYATNTAGTGYGSENSFYTLANVPSAPAVNGATSNTLNAAITSGDGNPAATEYAIHETTTNQFVQANGSLGATAVWQTAATWGTKTVTGLASSTTYTFEAKARNGSNTETGYSSTTNGTTLADATIDFGNLQHPPNTSVAEGGTTETIYAKAYEPGLTETNGDPVTLKSWIGISPIGAAANSNPNTWTTWIPAPWFSQEINDDQFAVAINTTTQNLTPGNYRYASRFQINNNSYSYGGYNGGFWDGTTNVSGVLTVTSNVVEYANIQFPFTGTITQGNAFNVYSRVFKTGYTEAAGANANIKAWIGYSTTNAATGSDFNNLSWTWIPATYNNVQVGNDDEYIANIGTSLPAGTYYYVSRFQVTGSTEYRYGGINNNFWAAPANSGVLTVQTPQEIDIKQGASIPTAGTYAFGNQISGTSGTAVTFTVENTGQTNLTVGALSISGTNASEFTITQPASPNVAGGGTTTFTVTFSPTSAGAKTAAISLINNDGNENPYVINLTGIGTRSAESQVVADPTYTAAPDILYASYVGTDVTATNSFEVGRFIVNDGASGSNNDADNLPTLLSTLGFNVSGSANISRVALYDGTTELGEVAGNTPITFSGLTVSVPDGGTKTLSVRILFNTAVTDNQLVKFSLSISNALATGSDFGTNGTQQSPDQFVEVIADRLAFVQQPTNTGINAAMAPAVTVAASDANGNKDLDVISGTVNLTSTGSLTGSSTTTATFSNGIATFSNLVHDALGTGLTLNATTTGFTNSNTATSSAFDITTLSYVDGDFMTQTVQPAGATWTNNATGTAKWFKRVGGIWVDNGEIPNGTSGAYTVFITENIEVPGPGVSGAFATAKIHILNNATFTYGNTSNQWTFRNIIVDSGASLYLKSRFTMLATGEFEVKDNGNFIFDYGVNGNSFSTGTGFYLNGIEKFHPNSNFIIKNTDAGDFLTPTGLSAITPNSANAYFGNIIVDYTNGENNLIFITPGTYTATQFQKALCNDLIFRNSNASPPRIYQPTSTYIGSTNKLTIQGNFTIEPTFTQSISFTTAGTGSGSYYLKINKNFINNAPVAFYQLNSSINVSNYVQVSGNVEIGSNSKYYLRNNVSSTATAQLEIGGNLQVALTGELSDLHTDPIIISTGNVWFNGTIPQTIDFKNQSSNTKIGYSTRNGANVSLINQNLSLGNSSTFTVKTGSSFNFGFNGTNALNILKSASATGTLAFTQETDSDLYITSPQGIQTSGATGNVQTDTRTFATASPYADYHFIGNGPQSTGDALPANVRNLVIENSGGAEVTLNNTSLNVTTNLDVQKGTFNLNDKTVAGASGSNLNIKGLAGLKISGDKTFPTGFETINFNSNSLVEYGGATQSIANTGDAGYTNLPEYQTLKISGTETKSPQTNLTVKEKVIVVSGELKIKGTPDNPDTATPNVLWAHRGIQNSSSGTVTLENNAQLMQDPDAENSGSIRVKRDLSLNNRQQYNYLISPTEGTNLKTIYRDDSGNPVTVPFVLYHDEKNNKFYNSTGAYIKGRALAVKEPAASFTPNVMTAVFEGAPANGEFSYTLVNSDTSTFGNPNRGYNLIGNPYPSNMDLDQFYKLNSGSGNLSATFYFWDNKANMQTAQQGDGYGGQAYAQFIAVSPPGTGTGIKATGEAQAVGTKVPTKIVKVGQGFMAKVQNTASLGISFNNNLRKPDHGIGFFGNESKSQNPVDRYWLNMITPANIASNIAIVYFPEGNNGLAIDDSPAMGGSDAIYSIVENKKISINGKSTFVPTDVVALGTSNFSTGNYTIALDAKEGIFANGQHIYLKDRQTGIITNLTEGAYTFTANAGETTGRFEIMYQPETVLGSDGTAKEELKVYRDGQEYVISSPGRKITGVEVYDTSGKLMMKSTTAQTEVRLNGNTWTDGVYILKMNRAGEVITKKVLK